MTTTETLAAISENRIKPVPGSLLARIDKVQPSSSRIILPTTLAYEAATATILALGEELPEYLRVGTRVLPHSASGLEILDTNGVRYVMYKLADLQVVFDNPTEAELETFFKEGNN